MYIIYLIFTLFIILILKKPIETFVDSECKSKLINCNKNQKQCLSNKLSTVRCIDTKNITKKQSNQRLNKNSFECPKEISKCLTKKYINKCGLCYDIFNNVTCENGNKIGAYKKKCAYGWKYLKYLKKNNEWTPMPITNKPVIICAYGQVC